jgi:hypothetical protein
VGLGFTSSSTAALIGTVPTAHSDEKFTIRLTPVTRPASYTASVPSALALNVVHGSSMDTPG